MNFDDQIRLFSESVVIIDDGFAPVSLDLIDGDDWAALRDAAAGEAEKWARVQDAYFPSLKSVMDLKRDNAKLARAWELYDEKPADFSILDPIFQKLVAKRHISILPLRPIIELFRDELKLTVCCHPDIRSASDDIKRSKLVFLDFYLYQQSTASTAISDIADFNGLLSDKILENSVPRDRFVFLISTQLPSGSDIENFRKAAKVKAAFFKSVSKNVLTKAWLTIELEKRLQRYQDLHRFSSYLDVFSKQMENVTKGLRADLEALELHDLSILHHMRLKADSENLGSYMSWIMSESLAARIRASAPMLIASQEVSIVNLPPLHGMLSPNHVLFELFSEISFSVPNHDPNVIKIGFGDVFVPATRREFFKRSSTDEATKTEQLKTTASGNSTAVKAANEDESAAAVHSLNKATSGPQAGQELLLVIAPACDLQRLPDDYEVLCVRGNITIRTPKLVDLLEQKISLGKDKDSGRYKNLLRIKEGLDTDFLLLEWHPEKITTLQGIHLQGSSHSRLARLNELFCQEVKEEALRQVGRIGVPVDPAFSIGLGCTIAYTVRKKGVIHIEVPDEHIVSGVFTTGNSSNPQTIILSDDFIEALDKEIAKVDTAAKYDKDLEEVSVKFASARAELAIMAGQGLALAKNERKLAKEKFTVRYVHEFVRDSLDSGFCGICFYPRGMVRDKPDNAHINVAA